MTHACPKLPHKQSASLFIDNVFYQLQQFKVILNNFRFILSTSDLIKNAIKRCISTRGRKNGPFTNYTLLLS